jgi:hypothetical protein
VGRVDNDPAGSKWNPMRSGDFRREVRFHIDRERACRPMEM